MASDADEIIEESHENIGGAGERSNAKEGGKGEREEREGREGDERRRRTTGPREPRLYQQIKIDVIKTGLWI